MADEPTFGLNAESAGLVEVTDQITSGLESADALEPALDFEAAADRIQKRSQAPATLDFEAAAERMSTQPAKAALQGAIGTNPDQAARTQALARKAGLPPQAVAGDEDQVQGRLDFDAAARRLSGAPSTAKFLADPNNAAVAHDSVKELTDIEKRAVMLRNSEKYSLFNIFTGSQPEVTPRPEQTREEKAAGLSAEAARRGAGSAAALGGAIDASGSMIAGVGTLQGVAIRAVNRPIYTALEDNGFEDLAAALRDMQTSAWFNPEKMLQSVGGGVRDFGRMVGPEEAQRGFLTDVTSGLGQLPVQVAAAIYTGGLGLLAQGVEQMRDDVKATKPEIEGSAEADTALLLGGAATAVMEKLGLNALLNKVPGVQSFLGRVLAGASVEAAEEFGEKVLQNLVALAIYDPDRNLLEEAAEGAQVGGAVGAIVATLLPSKRAMKMRENADELHKAIQGSPLTERSPEQALEHIRGALEDTGVEDTYISARVLLEASAKSEGAAAMFGADPAFFDKVQDEALIGGDILLTQEQLATVLASADVYPKIAEHIRYGAEALTADEAQDAVSRDTIDKMVKDALAPPKEGEAPPAPADTEMLAAEEVAGLQALFTSAKDAGLADKAYAAYLQKVAEARESARNRIEKRRLKAEEAKLTPEYRAALEQEIESARESLSNEPVYAAMNAIGRDRLDRQAIIDLLPDGQGEALLAQLPKIDGRQAYTTKTERGGVHPEVLAQQYGFDAADTMLFAMADAKPFDQAVAERAQQMMPVNHADLVQEIQGIKTAIQALHSDAQAQVLAYEMNAVRQAQGQKALSAALIKAEAKRRFDQMKLSEISPERFIAAERRAGVEAGKLIRSGKAVKSVNAKGKTVSKRDGTSDRDGAARAKFQQLMNFHFAQFAYDAQAEVRKQQRDLQKLSNPRQKQEGMDPEYVDLMHEKLSRISLIPPLTPEQREKRMARAAEKAIKTGGVFVIPPLVMAADQNADRVQMADLPYAEWRQFYEEVKQIEQQGKNVKKTNSRNAEADLEAVATALKEQAASLPDRNEAQRRADIQNPASFTDRVARTLSGLNAALAKVEYLLLKLDGGKIGPWHNAIFKPIVEAQTAQLDIMREHFKPLIGELEALSKEQNRPLTAKVRVAGLGNRQFQRSDILMLALNVGNDSNLNKVLEGSKKDGANPVPWTREGVNEALSHLTPREAAWIQKVWDSFERLYPKVEEVYRAEFGIRPAKVPAREVEIAGVKLKGGYFPMMYDASRNVRAGKAKFETALATFQDPFTQATVFSGMTEERTAYSAPVLLDLAKLPYSFQQLAHYITHYDAVRGAQKILDDHGVAYAITDKLGSKYKEELDRWLAAVATSGMTTRDLDEWDGWAQVLRTNITAAVMGFSFTTGASQILGLTSSVAVLGREAGGKFKGRTGLDWMTVGMETYLRNPAAAIRQATELSGEMRYRLDNVDRDVANASDRLTKRAAGLPGKAKSALILFNISSLKMIGGMQFGAVDVPTWLAAFNKGQYEGMDQDAAVAYADQVVRISQGTGHEKDLSNLQRKKGLWRIMTMFSSYTFVLQNMLVQTAGDAKKIRNLPGTFSRVMWVVVAASLLDAALRAEWPEEPEEPEEWAKWFAAKTIGYGFRAFPVIGNAVDAGIKGFKAELSPVEGIPKHVQAVIHQTSEAIENEEITLKTAEAYVRAFGTLFGVGGTTQAARALDAAAEDDATIYDYFIGYKAK